jgi:hypothetical protein
MMSHLVLCADHDLPALWAYQKLREQGFASLELVTASSLALAKTWIHRLGAEGVQLEIEFADGRRLFSSHIHGALNRLTFPSQNIINQAVAADHDYVAAETNAFYLSWMHSLPGMINRPMPHGLAGTWRHVTEWILLAARSGLNVPAYRQSSATPMDGGFVSLAPAGAAITHVIVFREDAYGLPADSPLHKPCKKFAERAETDLLGIDFFEDGAGNLVFAYATPMPDLRLGGDEFITALVRALKKESAS